MTENTIDMKKHIEICEEYEKKINDLYSKLSKLREDYDELKEDGEYFDYKDIKKAYKWIKILFSTNKKLYTSMVINGLYMGMYMSKYGRIKMNLKMRLKREDIEI